MPSLNTTWTTQAQPMPNLVSAHCQAEVWMPSRGSARPKWVKPGKTKNEGFAIPIPQKTAHHRLAIGPMRSTGAPQHRPNASPRVKLGKTNSSASHKPTPTSCRDAAATTPSPSGSSVQPRFNSQQINPIHQTPHLVKPGKTKIAPLNTDRSPQAQPIPSRVSARSK
jgi:hypothetical protein